MNCENLVFSSHAIQQMFFRRISKQEVKTAINYGEVIEQKPNDSPFPSYLILDFVNGQPLHVVFSYDERKDTGYVVTAYIPDNQLWTDNFRKRR
ncbi:MAG: DUF4258 domain-containing protein [Crocosphaera sp.]|uniref:DUF4258 domain-containing protein n=3 Tax=Crocosphaera watsonii TaxID=263511 RepID=T2JUP1_CROWT|nr:MULTISPECIES: DUF4258 domain-containing protein [Crocosphaera]EHJ09376.1 hypothetical protein CWATWH0003_B196 [Crocosphaera watsonii WH 0003]MCH2247753.1 DUF4258 domain-containing protein [Crocosphaera sp.]NQZ63694.1 DUF4258 domain-containing protein [Crocosphaera sp.]CCQ58657.1 hypothetical protein CWATWH0005_5724 [Crocosphaera watsonii WH 0005]CCQ68751.1 hypothetical protein CWATWH0402_1033 [Crocosphaera watsonii WH 0402]